MKIRILLSSLFVAAISSWKSVYTAFNSLSITTQELSQWVNPNNGASPYITTCSSSGAQYIYLEVTNNSSQTLISLPPHYSIQVVADLYFYGSFDLNEFASIYIDNNQEFIQYEYWKTMNTYSSVCYPNNIRFEEVTAFFTLNSHYLPSLTLKFYTNIDEQKSNENVGIRNVQVFIKPCHRTCLTCTGPSNLECLTCYYSSPLGDNSCNLCSDENAQFTHLTLGCLSECPNGYLADDQNYCILNENLIILQEFYRTTPFLNYEMEYLQLPPQLNVLPIMMYCGSEEIVGPFSSNDIQQKIIYFLQATVLVKIRASFYLNQWNNNEYLSIKVNEVNVCRVFYNSGILNSINCRIIYKQLNIICGVANYDFVRIELVYNLNVAANSILLQFSAQLHSNLNNKWGIRDIIIEGKACSLNCEVCKNRDNCQICFNGYKLHKGKCLLMCPVYSIDLGLICQDFDEENEMTIYKVKQFYDLSTDAETANNFFQFVSQNPPNFAKGSGIEFSYLDNKRIFGGTLVWRDAKFAKVITINESHYGIRLRMKVILGDNFSTGTFEYSVNSFSETLSRSSLGIDQQIWGSIDHDYQISVDTELIANSNNGVYQIFVECLGPNLGINQANCGIADFFITTLRCPFQCDSCTSYYSCQFDKTPSSPGFVNTVFRGCSDGYFINYQANLCQSCNLNFCNKCLDQFTCTECKTGYQLVGNICQCKSTQFLDINICKDCHPTCTSCQNDSISDCLSCNSLQFRVLQNNRCECQPYYQESSSSNHCQPICGDMYIVQGEDCDDGNLKRFDGCHNCKYECQEECLSCLQGKCYVCLEGYILNQIIHKCFKQSIPVIHSNSFELCGNLVIDQNEQCDDGNFNPFDGCDQCQIKYLASYETFLREENMRLDCYNFNYFPQCQVRQFQFESLIQDQNIQNYSIKYEIGSLFNNLNQLLDCPDNCQQCSESICLQCNKGWNLNKISNECETICGDQIVIGNEQCDDGNAVPYDGCFNCQYQCQEECDDCYLGKCQQCMEGWQINNFQCNTICGDGIKNGNEECDDGNDEQYDGCYECHYQCNQNCSICYEGQCSECKSGFLLLDYTCSSACGDGLFALGNEECDDFNLVDGDGCSHNCQIEEGWICTTQNGISLCKISSSPLMYLQVDKDDGSQFKSVNIKFTQFLKSITIQPIQFDIQVISVDNQNQEFYQYELNIINKPKLQEYTDVAYRVDITFLKNSQNNVLRIHILNKDQLINQQKQEIENNFAQLKLSYTNFLLQSEKEKVQTIQSMNSIVIYCFCFLSGTGILLGNLGLLWNILDLLQFFSYLKYVNNPFPENLNMYFSVFDQISLKPYQSKLGLNQIYSLPFGNTKFPYIKPSKRFADDEINSLLFDNISSVFFVFAFAYLSYLVRIIYHCTCKKDLDKMVSKHNFIYQEINLQQCQQLLLFIIVKTIIFIIL